MSLYSVLASQYHDSRAVYEARAAEHTEKYAKKIGWIEMRKVSDLIMCAVLKLLSQLFNNCDNNTVIVLLSRSIT